MPHAHAHTHAHTRAHTHTHTHTHTHCSSISEYKSQLLAIRKSKAVGGLIKDGLLFRLIAPIEISLTIKVAGAEQNVVK